MKKFWKKTEELTQAEKELIRLDEWLANLDPNSEDYEKVQTRRNELADRILEEKKLNKKEGLSKDCILTVGATVILTGLTYFANQSGITLERAEGKIPKINIPRKK